MFVGSCGPRFGGERYPHPSVEWKRVRKCRKRKGIEAAPLRVKSAEVDEKTEVRCWRLEEKRSDSKAELTQRTQRRGAQRETERKGMWGEKEKPFGALERWRRRDMVGGRRPFFEAER